MDDLPLPQHVRGYLMRDMAPGQFSVCLIIGDDDRPIPRVVPIRLSEDAPNGFTAGDLLDLSAEDATSCWRGVAFSFSQEEVIFNAE